MSKNFKTLLEISSWI